MERSKWDYDAEAGTLTLSGGGLPKLRADALMVGSYSAAAGTFEWAWTRPEPDRDIEAVRTFGAVRGIGRLVQPGWACPVGEAWAMAMLAGFLLDGEGFFRAPIEDLEWFMVLRHWRRLKR
jgi:hypothetical protein